MFSQIFAYNKCPLFRTTFTIDTTGNLCDFLFKDWHSAQGIHTSVCVRIYQGSLWADTSGTDKSRNHLKIRKNRRKKNEDSLVRRYEDTLSVTPPWFAFAFRCCVVVVLVAVVAAPGEGMSLLLLIFSGSSCFPVWGYVGTHVAEMRIKRD